MCAGRLLAAGPLFGFLFLLNIFQQKIERENTEIFSIKITRFAVVARFYLHWCCSIRAECAVTILLPTSIASSKTPSKTTVLLFEMFLKENMTGDKMKHFVMHFTHNTVANEMKRAELITMERLNIYEWERKKSLKPNGRSNATECCKCSLYPVRVRASTSRDERFRHLILRIDRSAVDRDNSKSTSIHWILLGFAPIQWFTANYDTPVATDDDYSRRKTVIEFVALIGKFSNWKIETIIITSSAIKLMVGTMLLFKLPQTEQKKNIITSIERVDGKTSMRYFIFEVCRPHQCNRPRTQIIPQPFDYTMYVNSVRSLLTIHLNYILHSNFNFCCCCWIRWAVAYDYGASVNGNERKWMERKI